MQASKRHKANSRPETPLSLYKQAVRLLRQQQCGDVTADELVKQKLQKALQLLQDKSEPHQADQTVTHSLDLELSDEPLYLLASIHLQLGQLEQQQGSLDAAEQQYRIALRYFPRFVAALSALGQVLKAAATSAATLSEAQQLLTQAIDIAQQLSEEQGRLLVESNKGCAAELEAADAARSALAMLLCQAGCDAQAAPHLQALGYKYRLSHEVLHYIIPQQPDRAALQGRATARNLQPLGVSNKQSDQAVSQGKHAAANNQPVRNDNQQSSSTSTCNFMRAVDQALPPPLLQHLQHVFQPGADFWQQHAYGRVGYFSYFFQMSEGDSSSSSMHQLARYLQQLGSQHFPNLKDAKYAECWAHCRRHSSGHQLHFDSDDEGQGGIRHPIITAIVYLSDNTHAAPSNPTSQPNSSSNSSCCCCTACSSSNAASCSCSRQSCVGGPTLMTDQVLGGPLASQGWLAYPAINRVVFFDGRYLHGVVPGHGPAPTPDGRRITLMMAFWRDLKCRTPPTAQCVGACMPMPNPGDTHTRAWHHELQPLAELGTADSATAVHEFQAVSAVWQSVEEGRSTSGAAYQYCYQGF